MSILSSILSKVFHPQASGAKAAQPASQPAPAPQPAPQTAPAPQSASFAPQPAVDVEGVLTSMAAYRDEHLNWRTSIVDLMKVLNLDPSLENRRELAHELGYTGDTSDTAAMNIWLHKAVMKKLAENGGQVPAELLQ